MSDRRKELVAYHEAVVTPCGGLMPELTTGAEDLASFPAVAPGG
jgi:hypothetical protein